MGLNVTHDSPFFGSFDNFGIVKRRPCPCVLNLPLPLRTQQAGGRRAHSRECAEVGRSSSKGMANRPGRASHHRLLSSPAAKPPTPRPQAHEPTTAPKRPKGEGAPKGGAGRGRAAERGRAAHDSGPPERRKPEPQGRADPGEARTTRTQQNIQFCWTRAGGTPGPNKTYILVGFVRRLPPPTSGGGPLRLNSGTTPGSKMGGYYDTPPWVMCDV